MIGNVYWGNLGLHGRPLNLKVANILNAPARHSDLPMEEARGP